jgi:hypothetical protein
LHLASLAHILPDLKEVWLTYKSIDEADEAEIFHVALTSMSEGRSKKDDEMQPQAAKSLLAPRNLR